MQFSEDPVKVGKAGPVARPDKGGSPWSSSGACVLLAPHRTGKGWLFRPVIAPFLPPIYSRVWGIQKLPLERTVSTFLHNPYPAQVTLAVVLDSSQGWRSDRLS